MDSWAGIDALEKHKVFNHKVIRKKILIVGPKSSHYTDCAIPTQKPYTSKLIINFNIFQEFLGLGCSHTERVQKCTSIFKQAWNLLEIFLDMQRTCFLEI